MMKKINPFLMLALFLSFTHLSIGQSLESCGTDEQALLNQAEAAYLQTYLEEKLGEIKLSGKRVLFITGSAASRAGSKSEYFDDIRSWNERNSRVATGITLLNAEEKEASGGYDIILTYWVKLFTEKRKRKIIRRLSKAKEI